jgi:hypothetical protein
VEALTQVNDLLAKINMFGETPKDRPSGSTPKDAHANARLHIFLSRDEKIGGFGILIAAPERPIFVPQIVLDLEKDASVEEAALITAEAMGAARQAGWQALVLDVTTKAALVAVAGWEADDTYTVGYYAVTRQNPLQVPYKGASLEEATKAFEAIK